MPEEAWGEGAVASAQMAGVVRDLAGGAGLERGAHVGRDGALGPGLGIDMHVDGLAGDQRLRLAREPKIARAEST